MTNKAQWNANQVAEIAKVDLGGAANYDRFDVKVRAAKVTGVNVQVLDFEYYEDDTVTAQSQGVDPIAFILALLPQLPTCTGVNVCRD